MIQFKKANTAVGTAWECYNKLLDLKVVQIKTSFNTKVEEAVGRLFTWALNKKPVQQAVLQSFSCGGPFNHMIMNAIESAAHDAVEEHGNNGEEPMTEDNVEEIVDRMLRDFEVEASNVSDLDDAVTEVLENAEFDASNIRNLDKAIAEVVENNQEEITKAVIEELVGRLRH